MPSLLHKERFEGIYATTTVSTTASVATTTSEDILYEYYYEEETMANKTNYQWNSKEDISVEQVLLEETLKQVNYLVQESDARKKVETSTEPEPLFGQIESEAQGLVDAMASRVQEASAGEIITLVVGIIVILYWIDRAMRYAFRAAVRKNYFMKEDRNGTPNWRKRAWVYIELGLEKVWMPLWCSGEKIRQDTLVECVDEEFEAARRRVEAMRAPNNTLVEPQAPAPIGSTVRAPPVAINDENELERRLQR